MVAGGKIGDGRARTRRLRALVENDCACSKCSKIQEVTLEETMLRVRFLCEGVIEAAWNDLFLLEKGKEKKEGNEKAADAPQEELDAPQEEVVRAWAVSQPEKATPVLEKLCKMCPKKRIEALAAMRSAYEWLFSDERLIFRSAHEKDMVGAEDYIPFLFACEAVGVDPDCIRKEMWDRMAQNGLSPKMLRSGRFPRPRSEAVAEVARSEARVDRLFRVLGPNRT